MNATPTHAPTHRASLTRSAAYASIATALFLVGLKAWAAWHTGSTAMLGSLADTALDLVASLATLIGVWVAAYPADRHHRFGHGKAEAVAAMFQIVLISISAIGIAFRAVEQFLSGARTESAGEGIAVSVIAMAATLVLLAWQRHVIRRTGSLAIATDHVHYQSDLLLNLAVIAALVLDQYLGLAGADPLFGLAIALWLAWGARKAWHDVVGHLMDREWPEERKQRLLGLIAGHPGLRGVHDLRTRMAGTHDFAQFHIWLDGAMSLREVHRVMDELERRIAHEFPDTEILIHPDPEGLMDETGIAAEEMLPGKRAD